MSNREGQNYPQDGPSTGGCKWKKISSGGGKKNSPMASLALVHVWLILLRNLFSRKFFIKSWYKNFVKSTVCITVWKLRNFTAVILSQKFRESNFFSKFLWRKTIRMVVTFSFFHIVHIAAQCGNFSHIFLTKFRENNTSKEVTTERWFRWKRISRYFTAM